MPEPESHNKPDLSSSVRHRGSIDDNAETLSAIIRERNAASGPKINKNPFLAFISFSLALIFVPLSVFWYTKNMLFEGTL
jgi:hypothetical protein